MWSSLRTPWRLVQRRFGATVSDAWIKLSRGMRAKIYGGTQQNPPRGLSCPCGADASRSGRVRDPAPPFGEEFGNLALRHRLAEQEALGLVTAFRFRHFELLFGLDALDYGGDPQAGGEARHRADDGAGIVALRHVAHELAVDLDLVEREASQVGERRVAGPDIVHRDPHAEIAQLMQR